ncbi:hypothetical protein MKZ38_004446 [Zalerion maritima]|uniref:Uncharacterized protein n=1 Tax=Zalerion maritima TaxID=339359 RepID=A0AAD5S4D0_9PEZI|nr:hypothetical protein MKZ38_004446 [Zalerion maritima]
MTGVAASAPLLVEPSQHFLRPTPHVPNSRFPVLVYRNVLCGFAPDRILEAIHANGWKKGGQWKTYKTAHFHSNTHECYAVLQGSSTLLLGKSPADADSDVEGNEFGMKISVSPGDVFVLPESPKYDMNYCEDSPAETREKAAACQDVPVPEVDPVYGSEGPLPKIWNDHGATLDGNGYRSKAAEYKAADEHFGCSMELVNIISEISALSSSFRLDPQEQACKRTMADSLERRAHHIRFRNPGGADDYLLKRAECFRVAILVNELCGAITEGQPRRYFPMWPLFIAGCACSSDDHRRAVLHMFVILDGKWPIMEYFNRLGGNLDYSADSRTMWQQSQVQLRRLAGNNQQVWLEVIPKSKENTEPINDSVCQTNGDDSGTGYARTGARIWVRGSLGSFIIHFAERVAFQIFGLDGDWAI